MVRSEGLEPPRFYSLPPQGSASTNSATSAGMPAQGSGRINGADVTNRPWGDKARRRPKSGVYGGIFVDLARARRFGQHLLDLDRDAVAVDQDDAAGDQQIVGQHLDLVGLGRVQFDDGAAGQPHDLVDGHSRGPEDHHEIDGYFIERGHFRTAELRLG